MSFRGLRPIVIPFLYVSLSLVVGLVVLMAFDWNPFEVYGLIFGSVFGSTDDIFKTLIAATPIMFTGLAAAVAFKCDLINIGIEGQFLMGALAATLVGNLPIGLPEWQHLALAIAAGGVGGALWAVIAGLLRAYRGVHEVITSIMLNYIAFEVASYAINTLGTTDFEGPHGILVNLQLPKLPEIFPQLGGTLITVGFVFIVLACIIMQLIFKKTVFGYEIRAIGFDQKMAKRSGVNIPKNVMWVMIVSGLLAGLGGTQSVLGEYHSFLKGVSPTPGHGSIGIAAALLASNNPIAVIVAAILFGALATSRTYLTATGYLPFSIINIIQASIMCFVAIGYAKTRISRNSSEVNL